jgi:hypothetical protein
MSIELSTMNSKNQRQQEEMNKQMAELTGLFKGQNKVLNELRELISKEVK